MSKTQVQQAAGGVANTTASMNWDAYQEEMVVASITNWNLTDVQDRALQLGGRARESVQMLPSTVFAQIFDVVNRLNEKPGRTNPEEVAFRPEGGSGDPDGDTSSD